ncbi:uncharacterized protein Z520_11401 [Fonsecaea multimorphosa CBS 102226]|uniref:3-hydroxyacyl-CoA dehydrogenase NAD binding domain-containing protein n=1 Tax=Fonsecaea multimorphosa CBS 102226 TaxID=1442371 RepID=A0A0D2GTY7_9EURO|nr:uncharacterized protein Z520_11401 [Fonsecaea multimorphosa CBS 102226]KIX92925.1 hypothetical protein Z520_11401 [Fonsecaea multimorphosa CBS 102226]OAL18174.1 hypothetical protein AYO22_10951 [Fonsecaea multimorphosa]
MPGPAVQEQLQPSELASTSTSTSTPLPHGSEHVALIGVGAIGISFLALHLTYTAARVSVFDPRPDLQEHVAAILPLYLPSPSSTTGASSASASASASASGGLEAEGGELSVEKLVSSGRLRFCSTLREAVQNATIVQEQGPENLSFKQRTWSEVLRHVSPQTHLWSSTSGIPASQQLKHLTTTSTETTASGPSPTTATVPSDSDLSEETKSSAHSRLLIVHPFNPPHLMPLLEIVPSPHTSPTSTGFARTYFSQLSSVHRPITIARETAGFVANRLAFILFREACHLVRSGVCTVADMDEIVRASLGPRWAVAGPFKMYNFGGGARGMAGFLDNIGESIDGVWRDAGELSMDDDEWKDAVIKQCAQAYGVPSPEDIRKRDRGLKAVVRVQDELEQEQGQGQGQKLP